MLLSIALILCSGLLFGSICRVIRFPSLFGMIIAGIVIGPHLLNLIDPSILNISSELRRIALIVILIRAGLKLKLSDLAQVGRPAVLMCFVPACLEIAGMIFLAPRLLGISALDAAIMGAVVGAVSPAVIVPRMIRLIDEGYGVKEGIPQMILAGASVDDVFVIVLFTSFTGLAQGHSLSAVRFISIPLSILTGIAGGFVVGYLLLALFQRVVIGDTVKLVLIMSLSFALVTFEDTFSAKLPFAALIAIMSMGAALRRAEPVLAVRLSQRFDHLWIPAELFLFVLVGASVAIESALDAGGSAVVLILSVLVFRMAGVFVCLLGLQLKPKEKLFCMLAYTPKATVQAAIGGLPLAMGLSCGQIVLTVSVIAILITAPMGAFAIDLTYAGCLERTTDEDTEKT